LRSRAASQRPTTQPDADRSAERRRALLILPGLAVVVLLFLYPLATLVVTSVHDEGWTLQHYRRLFTVPAYLKVLRNTIQTAGLVTVICLALGYPLAYRLATSSGLLRTVLIVGILMPFWTSLLVRAYGWMVILHPSGLLNTVALWTGIVTEPLELVHNTTGVLIGMTQIMLPYMVLPIAAVMQGLDPRLLQAASSLGASPWRRFVWVYAPLTLPGVLAGCLLVFIISLGFFVIPALLGGTRDILLAQLIDFNMSKVLNWGFAAALSTALLVATLALYAVAGRVLRFQALWGSLR
jgi:putative spermidine/putrescine transport system permease protein